MSTSPSIEASPLNERVLKVLSRGQEVWTKGAYERFPPDGPTCYCLSGMIRRCYPANSKPAMDAAAAVIKEKFSDRRRWDAYEQSETVVISFNDDEQTTYEEVVEVARLAGI